MDSPTTPKPNVQQFELEDLTPPKTWHPKTRSAGLGWMERTGVRYLYMYFDIREYVLEEMTATAQEIDFLVLRRLVPRPLTYPSMEELKTTPPDGFRRISIRYLMTDIPDMHENNKEDIMPALRRIRIHLKRLSNVEGPFRPFKLWDPDFLKQLVVLKLDFYPDFHPSQPEASPEREYDSVNTSQNTISRISQTASFDLSDCSSFQEPPYEPY
ncbi:hypothetical protein P170DRAFT_473612 [Aspergillus steynii IBT 23096]|uniref:Uncharacterized protein n=1 Tax=Aspergillus steynii IBT 23096 TaxID=1392250 RepID=A0A2I2GAX9_9EURO|nr:uncharacterized protein P170DRAFT_473612 [Aspergillus steynii IBT 23096]PLB50038.1 hypothetical protein P170DRAFT_473612 [Aspergillus steynii IBT 23096]